MLVTFCVLLLGTLGVVFTRVVAARVPEQRATLEKLITDRTGLAVRFDNVHFAWNLDGTSAVFERVELTDPKRGRVRVVAPELRVEFDTWDYLRHHQFSLGHVTLSSPDIEIVGDPLDAPLNMPAPRGRRAQAPARLPAEDEAALVRRFTAWAELMPNGRVEVEGARVHLLRRGSLGGKGGARTTFTLSQAVVSRGASTFNAFGTMLLSQDVGQSLFLSAKLEGLGAGSTVSGELRMIARRVFLDKLPMIAAKGRGTLDATLRLRNGRIDSAGWQASARELEFGDDAHSRFDHLTVNGTLERDADDFLLKFGDLQLTRGARLERSPQLSARLTLAPGTTRIARTRIRAERVPFMAAEFLGLALAPGFDGGSLKFLREFPGGWTLSAGELRDVRFDSGADSRGRMFSAQLTGVELARDSDQVRIAQLATLLQLDGNTLTFNFDPANNATLRVDRASEARPFSLGGQLMVNTQPANLRFEAFVARSGAGSIEVQGAWDADPRATPLTLTIANLDRALFRDGWTLLKPDEQAPLLADIRQGNVFEGTLELLPDHDAAGLSAVNWQRSSGTLKLEELATSGEDIPHLVSGRGVLAFSRGNTRLQLDGGELDQLAVTSARLEWPRSGAPRLQAALQGELSSPLLRGALKAQGLERLAGSVTLVAEARGEKELRTPESWRVTARLGNASIPLAGDLPPIEKIAGTVRYAGGQLRGLTLAGNWLGGPLTIESRRAARGGLGFGVTGVADAAPLLRLLGQDEAASLVNGQLSWTGSAQLVAAAGEGNDGWQLEFASTLAGIESRLPEPFDKIRPRQLPISAQLRVDADGIHEFVIDGRELAIRGAIDGGVTKARFEVQGVAGELRRTADAAPQLHFQRLDLKRAPAVLAAVGSLLPADGELDLNIDDTLYSGRSLGGLQASLSRRDAGVEFSVDSVESAPHQLTARGSCASVDGRCRVSFTADTQHLASLLGGTQLPREWPTETLHAAGELTWPIDSKGDLTREIAGRFELETQGSDSNHQLVADATLADGQIELANVQGTGPAADQLFRGSGRVALLAREYDLAVDFEQVSLAATAVPTPARARLARAWTVLRGSAARRGWTEVPAARRVQWHGNWD
ncbi:MAG TPA: DUF3971 domain-containing protein [Steroidobacteraceae bacterium]|nr:DUF3971 domain-containing protein [Steroidobacteraceae bacterium]